jgi:predicted nucleic acid-binding protein
MPKYLIDTNLLIRAFDPKANAQPDQVSDAKARLLALMEDPTASLVLNPLILFEATSGIEHADKDRLDTIHKELSQLEMISVGEAEAVFAARISRYAPSMGRVLNKARKFDLLHFASAELNGLEVATADPDDFKTIQRVYQELKKHDS